MPVEEKPVLCHEEVNQRSTAMDVFHERVELLFPWVWKLLSKLTVNRSSRVFVISMRFVAIPVNRCSFLCSFKGLGGRWQATGLLSAKEKKLERGPKSE